jgi:hypothetical protein
VARFAGCGPFLTLRRREGEREAGDEAAMAFVLYAQRPFNLRRDYTRLGRPA